ncbi:MAG: histidine phosphatase family protein [Acidimicrobiia bacterium]
MPRLPDDAEVWLVRHARSEANAEGKWQGRIDGGLDTVGLEQLERLATRAARFKFDVVLSSPLQRAVKTAAVFGHPVVEPALIEIDLGRWDGLTTAELLHAHRTDLESFGRGEEVRFGTTGETPSEIAARIYSVVDRLFERLQPGQRAVAVSHGAALDAITHRLFGRDRGGRRLGGLSDNTGITRLVRRFDRIRAASFNDTGHLGNRPPAVRSALESERPALVLVRHGQTMANVEGRWQGQSDWGLDQVGLGQVAALADWYGRPDRVVSSPLGRALETARVLSDAPEVHAGLAELGFGPWEGLTTDEVRAGFAQLFDDIFLRGQDLPRGVSGESWSQLTERIRTTIASISPEPGKLTAAVTHGAAIRSYLADLSGGGWATAGSLETPANASVTHLVMGERGPLIVDFSSAVHLETIPIGKP